VVLFRKLHRVRSRLAMQFPWTYSCCCKQRKKLLQDVPWHLLIAIVLLLEMVIASKSRVAAGQLSQHIRTVYLEHVLAPGSVICRTRKHMLGERDMQ